MNKYLKIGYIVYYFTPHEIAHLREELIDCELISFPATPLLEAALKAEEVSAYAKKIQDIPVYDEENPLVIAALMTRDIEYLSSIQESLPLNGQGIIGIVCDREQIVTRQLLSELHDLETGYCSNIERRVLVSYPDVQVHCQIDRANRYKLGIRVKKENEELPFYFSQSTFVGLAEKAIQEIKDS